MSPGPGAAWLCLWEAPSMHLAGGCPRGGGGGGITSTGGGGGAFDADNGGERPGGKLPANGKSKAACEPWQQVCGKLAS